jgi:hypothetical protein
MQQDLPTPKRKLWHNKKTRPSSLKIPWSEGIHPSQTSSLELIARNPQQTYINKLENYQDKQMQKNQFKF